MSTTAIYHDGRNSYQVNFSGTIEQAKNLFLNEMSGREVVWAKLFVATNGNFVAEYPPASIEHQQGI